MCYYGKTLIGKKNLNDNQQKDIEFYLKHESFKNLHHKNFSEKKENLKENECMIIMDFKQNFILGKGPVETNYDFYNKEHVSCLGFCLIYKNNGVVNRKYFNYLSKILSHDSLFVGDCIIDLIGKHIKNRFQIVNFWSDNGGHFRSSEMYNHIFNTIPKHYDLIKVTLNFFVEYHGKSEVDGHFGHLQRVYDKINKSTRINDIEQLINIFQK